MLAALAAMLLLNGSSHCIAQYVIEPVDAVGSHLQFVSPALGFAIGANSIARTADSGRTWRRIAADLHALTGCDNVMQGTFADSATGWIITSTSASNADSTFIYGTTDGGATWRRQLASPIASRRYASHIFTSIHFADRKVGWVVGKGIIEHTTDGGATWSTQLLWDERESNNDVLNCIHFHGRDEGWVGGYGSIILHTSDGGAHWTTQHVDSAAADGIILHIDNYYLDAICFADSLNGFAATNNGNYLHTSDGGATWHQGYTGYPNDNVALFAADRDLIWQVGGDYCDNTGCYSGQSILYSKDAGVTWHALVDTTLGLIGFNSQFRSIHFIDRKLGYIASDGGRIFRIRDTSASVANVRRPADEAAQGFRVYPNPAREELVLDLGTAAPEAILYDMTGHALRSIELGDARRVAMPVSDLPSGPYLIEVGGERRMVIVAR